jgi:hypothetical protein
MKQQDAITIDHQHDHDRVKTLMVIGAAAGAVADLATLAWDG